MRTRRAGCGHGEFLHGHTYVPDPVAEERISAGVVVFDAAMVRVRFVENWERLHRFANTDVTFLKDLARDYAARIEPGYVEGKIDGGAIRAMALTWRSAIQFTAPRGSLLELAAMSPSNIHQKPLK